MKKFFYLFCVMLIIVFVLKSAVAVPKKKPLRDPFSLGQLIPVRKNDFFKLHYAKAKKIASLLKHERGRLLSKGGHVEVNERTNTVWVSDFARQLAHVRAFIHRLDVPAKQVLIQAHIVEVDRRFMRELGIRLTGSMKTKGGLNMSVPLLAAAHPSIAIAKLGMEVLLNLELIALESEGRGRIIASPKLTTLDRNTAVIESGEEIPYRERSAEGRRYVVFKKAALQLKVTPEITSEHQMILHLLVHQRRLGAAVEDGLHTFQTQEVQTQVSVKDGQTVVLGGVFEKQENNHRTSPLLLARLPFIGRLFRRHQTVSEQREWLVFVTPRIL